MEQPEDIARIFERVSEVPPHLREEALRALGLQPEELEVLRRMLELYERELRRR